MSAYLMHSLSEYRELIDDLLCAKGPRCILEIGSEFSIMTALLCEYAVKKDALVFVADPGVSDLGKELIDRYKKTLFYHKNKSVDVIPALKDRVDFSLVDGDHNYWTVSNELDLLYKNNPDAWHILHDVGFPWGRRDLYYDYEAIPSEARNVNSDKGIGEGNVVVERGGFCGAGQFTFAKEYGGGGNGVLTAVEDFLAQHPDLAFYKLPAIFGLGVIVPAADAETVEKIVAPYMIPLLERMERNRMSLYLHVLKLQSDLDAYRKLFRLVPGRRFLSRVISKFLT